MYYLSVRATVLVLLSSLIFWVQATAQQPKHTTRTQEKPIAQHPLLNDQDVITPDGPSHTSGRASSLTVINLSVPDVKRLVSVALDTNRSNTVKYLYLSSYSCHNCFLLIEDISRWLSKSKRPYTFQVLVIKPEKVSVQTVRAQLHAAGLTDKMADFYTADHYLRPFTKQLLENQGVAYEAATHELIVNAKSGLRQLAKDISKDKVLEQ